MDITSNLTLNKFNVTNDGAVTGETYLTKFSSENISLIDTWAGKVNAALAAHTTIRLTATASSNTASGSVYAVTLTGKTALTADSVYIVQFSATNAGATTLNFNSSAFTVPVKKISNGSLVALSGSELYKDVPYTLVYDGSNSCLVICDSVAQNSKALNGNADTAFVKKTEVVNNLTSTSTNTPLSAAQGKAVNDTLSSHTSNTTSHITATERSTWNGKAAGTHTHTKSEITDFPTTLKNPSALTVQLNGTNSATYDGSAAATVNVTPAGIGAATSGHTHGTLVPIAIPASANLNSYTTSGMYYCAANSTVATLTNCPTSNAFSLLVERHAGTKQTLTEYITTGAKTYSRNYYSSTSTWGAWYRIYTTVDPPTAVSGNAGTATKLATSRTISLTGDVTGSASFDGSANASITATVADDSHNHVISNVDGLQSALDGKSATGHTHSSATTSAAGLMSAADKAKLDGVAAGAQVNPTALKNPYALTLNNVTYDGSAAKDFGSFSNPNGFDNSDFRVNQRGQTTYALQNGYTVDRWKLIVSSMSHIKSVTVKADGILIKTTEGAGTGFADFFQYFEKPLTVGQTYTVSALVNGTIVKTSGALTSENDVIVGNGLLIERIRAGIRLNDSDCEIAWMKIELGAVATPYVTPNPAVELAKCQRYFYAETNIYGASLACTSARGMNGAINFPVTMRIHPTIVIVKMRDTITDEILTPTSCTILLTKNAISALFNFSGMQSLTVGHYYEVVFTASADL